MSPRLPDQTSNTLIVWGMGRYNEENFSGDRQLVQKMGQAGIDMALVGMDGLPGIISKEVRGQTVYDADYSPGHFLRRIDDTMSEHRKYYNRILLGGFSYGGMMAALRQAVATPFGLAPVEGLALVMPNEFFHAGDPYQPTRDLQHFAGQYATHHTIDIEYGGPWVEYRSQESADPTRGEIQYRTKRAVMYRHLQPYVNFLGYLPLTVTGVQQLADQIDVPTLVLAGSLDVVNRDTEGLYRSLPPTIQHDYVELPGVSHDYRDYLEQMNAVHATLEDWAVQL